MTNKDYLEKLLKLCTEEQLAMFRKMYPNYPMGNQVPRAIQQVEQTILDLNKAVQRLRNIEAEYDQFKIDTDKLFHASAAKLNEAKEAMQVLLKVNEALSTPEKVFNADTNYALAKLAALEAAGVDNWEGYDFAMEQF